MSPLIRRALGAVLTAITVGVLSALIWPGDVSGEPMEVGHWVAVGGFLVTGVLLLLAAVLVFVAVVGSTWRVKDFDPNEYLDDLGRDR